MKDRFDVAVVGAGVTGLSAALFLAAGEQAHRFRLHVLDSGKRPKVDSSSAPLLRVSAISNGSAAYLADCGAWQRVPEDRYCAYDHMRVWDAQAEHDGPATLRFDAGELGVPHLGYIVEDALLRSALLLELEARGVDVQFETVLDAVAFSPSGRQKLSAGNAGVDADLVLAADGSKSQLRELAGIPTRSMPYAQDAVVTHVATERPHRATAWQRFLPEGPLALLPLADGRVSVIWSTTREQASDALDASDQDLGEMLTSMSDGVLGQLSAPGERGKFTLVARHAERYVGHGLALLGDAAHTIHPLAGQGANLGVADAFQLALVLEDAVAAGEYPGDRPVLRRYERARRGENAAMLHFLSALNRLYATDSAVTGQLRRTGMQWFNNSGPVYRRVAGIALGQRRGS